MLKQALLPIYTPKVWQRIYADLWMPPRFSIYEHLLEVSLTLGYQVHSIFSFWQLLKANQFDPTTQKYLILRHDIDTDVGAAKQMWQIEQKQGVRSSFYFRLSTIDLPLMQKIENSGAEASYHYEEIANVAKKLGLTTPAQVEHYLPYIQKQFRHNFCFLKKKSGLRMATVASHGDFVNRKLQIPNHYLLKTKALRDELRIEVEAYDIDIMQHVKARFSDTTYPHFWKPSDPLEALSQGVDVIYLLTHPRHWQAAPWENIKDNLLRVWEGIKYSLNAYRKQMIKPRSA